LPEEPVVPVPTDVPSSGAGAAGVGEGAGFCGCGTGSKVGGAGATDSDLAPGAASTTRVAGSVGRMATASVSPAASRDTLQVEGEPALSGVASTACTARAVRCLTIN